MLALQQDFVFVFNDVARLLHKRLAQRAKGGARLARAQWQTLTFLADNQGIHQGALAEILKLQPITLVRIIDRLAERGLVERRRHPTDRRVRLLYLRQEVDPFLAEMQEISDAACREALERVSPAQREQLYEILSLMKSNLVAACRKEAAGEVKKNG